VGKLSPDPLVMSLPSKSVHDWRGGIFYALMLYCLHVTHGASVFSLNNESSDGIGVIRHVRRQLLSSRLQILNLYINRASLMDRDLTQTHL